MSTRSGGATDTRPYRYPGAQHFDESSQARKVFFGRKKDSSALLYQVLADDFVVVFGSSGHGKSSLIRAGLLPPLREKGYFPVVVRVSHEAGPVAAIMEAVREHAAAEGVDCEVGSEASLWHFFATLKLTRDGSELTPVLILDQFEELFTLVDGATRMTFVDAFADLVLDTRPTDVEVDPELQLGRPRLKVVISIRGDFLFELESLPRNVPQVFQSRYRVLPLRREQAADAIVLPAEDASMRDGVSAWQGEGPFEWSDEAVDEILDYLTGLEDGTGHEDEVSPFLLQLVCQSAERSIIDGTLTSPIPEGWREVIAGTDSSEGGLEGILKEYYRRCLKTAPTTRRGAQKKIRDLCEEALVSEDGYRNSLDPLSIRRLITEEELEHLEHERLVTSHLRGTVQYYELSHDGLVRAVYLAREERRQKDRKRFWGAAAGVAGVLLVAGLFQLPGLRDTQLLEAAEGVFEHHPDRSRLALNLLNEVQDYAQLDWADDVNRALTETTVGPAAGQSNASALSSSGGYAVVGAGDGFGYWDVDAWDPENSNFVEVPGDSSSGAELLRTAMSSASGWVGLGFDKGGVVVWRATDTVISVVIPADVPDSAAAIRGVGIATEQRWVVSGDEAGVLRLTDISSPERQRPLDADTLVGEIIWTLALREGDPPLVASATRSGWVHLWDIGDESFGEPDSEYAGGLGGVNVPTLEFGGADGSALLVVRRAGPSWLIDVGDRTLGDVLDLGDVRVATFSPDRERLLTMANDGTLTLQALSRDGFGDLMLTEVSADSDFPPEHPGEGNARWVTLLDSLDSGQPFLAATSRTDGTVRLWEGASDGRFSGRYVEILDDGTRGLFVPRKSVGMHDLVTANPAGRIRSYRLPYLAPLLEVDEGAPSAVQFEGIKATLSALPAGCLDAATRDTIDALRVVQDTTEVQRVRLPWWFGFADGWVRVTRKWPFGRDSLDVCP